MDKKTLVGAFSVFVVVIVSLIVYNKWIASKI